MLRGKNVEPHCGISTIQSSDGCGMSGSNKKSVTNKIASQGSGHMLIPILNSNTTEKLSQETVILRSKITPS